MASIPAIRDALSAQITANTTLRSADIVPGAINPPVVVVRPARGTLIEYQQTFDGGQNLFFEAVCLVGAADQAASQDLLDAILSSSGTNSVFAAINTDPTLGGLVSYAVVTQASGYGLIAWAGVDYLGSTLTVQVDAP